MRQKERGFTLFRWTGPIRVRASGRSRLVQQRRWCGSIPKGGIMPGETRFRARSESSPRRSACRRWPVHSTRPSPSAAERLSTPGGGRRLGSHQDRASRPRPSGRRDRAASSRFLSSTASPSSDPRRQARHNAASRTFDRLIERLIQGRGHRAATAAAGARHSLSEGGRAEVTSSHGPQVDDRVAHDLILLRRPRVTQRKEFATILSRAEPDRRRGRRRSFMLCSRNSATTVASLISG